jgi:hypothetical protein
MKFVCYIQYNYTYFNSVLLLQCMTNVFIPAHRFHKQKIGHLIN